jgi:hypothetical protein
VRIDPVKAELEAYESLTKLLNQAEESRRLFERANLAIPETLKRLFGSNGTSPYPARMYIPPIERHRRPPEAFDNWLSIPIRDATPTSIVKAILRSNAEPVSPKRMVEFVTAYLPSVPAGTVYNVGARLAKAGKLYRDSSGWTLKDNEKEKTGILYEGFLWGPEDAFEKFELATHRREAITHLLGLNKSGLQIVQVVENLQGCTWVHAPVNKDLLKTDFEELRKAEKVRRVGNSKKWELAPESKVEE